VVLPDEEGPAIKMMRGRRFLAQGGDLGGHFSHVALVQGLRDQDQLPDAAGLDGIVQRADIGDREPFQPGAILPEGRQQLGILGQGQQLGRPVAAREAQGEAAVGPHQAEPAQVARGGHHITVVVILVISQAVQGQVILAAVGQQPDLVLVVLGFEVLDRLADRTSLFSKGISLSTRRRIWASSSASSESLSGSLSIIWQKYPPEATEWSIVKGDVGEQVVEGRVHQEGQRAAVDEHAVCFAHGDRAHGGLP
jgi:hypothetical protein